MTDPKEFQLATIRAAMVRLQDSASSRRFLVADEVGLGKTVVAQHVIDQMMRQRRNRPLVVFYVCSSLSIATQNQKKLLELLPEDQRRDATCQVDRLTLLPASGRPQHPRLNLYTLTPDTSIPERGGMRRDGRVQERALIDVLVRFLWPEFFNKRPQDFFRRQAGEASWSYWVARERQRLDGGPLNGLSPRDRRRLVRAFNDSVRRQLELNLREWVSTKLNTITDDLEIIAKLRSALAFCALAEIRPDLVIFDEFQRFRDLLDETIDDSASRVISGLRGDGGEQSPALMLLSATPYRLYSRRWEDGHGQSHHEEFFQLINFLYGNTDQGKEKQQACRRAFLTLELEIRKGEIDSDLAKQTRQTIQRLLQPVMSRTERASLAAGWENFSTELLDADLKAPDLKVYRHLTESLKLEHRSHSVPYWTSIPLPMQTMGPRYVVRKEASPKPAENLPVLMQAHRDSFVAPAEWAHPRLRSLLKHFTIERLALPWLPPSLPWWSLGGQWRRQGQDDYGKILIFSRFRAVPQAVAALVSYALESYFLQQSRLSYQDVTKRRSLTANVGRYPLLAYFHPSPWLCTVTDPLEGRGRKIGDVRAVVKSQLTCALEKVGVQILTEGPSRPAWKLLAALEAKAGNWPWIQAAWQELHHQDSRTATADAEAIKGLGILLEGWEKARLELGELTHVTPQELDRLVDLALSAPGIVVGRALLRHWPEALQPTNYLQTLQVSWNGLRTYLDQRWFVAMLVKKDTGKYPTALLQAVLDGNLEAVLDEHLWIIHKLHGLEGARLAHELRTGLSLRTTPFKLHTPEKDLRQGESDNGQEFTLRCHVAMPFTEARLVSVREDGSEEELGLRSDELRKSFNTPFWPYVLTTTSVGQEGLDFHVWCSQLVHWDLCNNPMDLEQREGRIQRFGGLAIRRAIARQLGGETLDVLDRLQSPWAKLGALANSKLADESGLQPWWVYEGAAIRRFVFQVPSSEQQQRLAWLKEQRMIYRLALGQPNQEDLLDVVVSRNNLSAEKLRQAAIGLSAYFDTERDGKFGGEAS